jgi:hypothetical protein
VGVCKPAIVRSSVVFPAPLGPINPSSVPPVSEMETSRTASNVPNRTRRFRTSTTGAIPANVGAPAPVSGTPLSMSGG